jgi:hypothetical protein
MFIGVAILSTESKKVRRLRDEIKRRHPGPWQQAEALKHRMRKWLGLEKKD